MLGTTVAYCTLVPLNLSSDQQLLVSRAPNTILCMPTFAL